MSDKIKQLAEARQEKGGTKEEIEKFSRQRAKELQNIAEKTEEPDYLASGTETCPEDKKDEK